MAAGVEGGCRGDLPFFLVLFGAGGVRLLWCRWTRIECGFFGARAGLFVFLFRVPARGRAARRFAALGRLRGCLYGLFFSTDAGDSLSVRVPTRAPEPPPGTAGPVSAPTAFSKSDQRETRKNSACNWRVPQNTTRLRCSINTRLRGAG
nr:hypothetical protein [Pandoravirus belohorizontensis]